MMRQTLMTLAIVLGLTALAQAEGKNPTVLISTSMGDIKVELDAAAHAS